MTQDDQVIREFVNPCVCYAYKGNVSVLIQLLPNFWLQLNGKDFSRSVKYSS